MLYSSYKERGDRLLHVVSVPQVNPFTLRAAWHTTNQDTPSHIHEECEIYVNVSGDVSFMVENHLYPVGWGDIILSRPYEYHHCVYNSDKPHEHFWILFSVNGNEALLRPFFDRERGEKNRLVLPPAEKIRCLQICRRLAQEESGSTPAEGLRLFFDLLHLLEDAEPDESPVPANTLPTELAGVVAHMHAHCTEPETVRELAARFHISVNTLERYFRRHLAISPRGYLENLRLAHAARCLAGGCTVLEACTQSGFPDCSRFIAVFKRHFGLTPLQYRKARGMQTK